MTYDKDVAESIAKKVRWTRRLSVVPRWSCVFTQRRQNVAEHCFHVAQLVRLVVPYVSVENPAQFRVDCIDKALDHDEDEAATGDMPGPSKPKKNWAVEAKKGQVHLVTKFCDIMEMYLFLLEEQIMGNGYGLTVIQDQHFVDLRDISQHIKWKDGVSGPDLFRAIVAGVASGDHPVLERARNANH